MRSVVLAWVSVVKTLLAELLSRKSVPAVRLERPRPASLKVTPVIASFEAPVSSNVRSRVSPFSRLMPLNEESCAVVLICGQDLVVLRDQAGTCGLRVRIGDRSSRGQAAELRCGAAGECADRRRGRVVRGRDGDRAAGVDAGLQVIRRQRGIEFVEGRNLAAAGAEGDVGCGAAAGGGDLQRLAADRAEAPRAVVPAVRPRAVSVPAAPPITSGDVVPVLRTSLAGTERRRAGGCAGDGVDGGQQVAHRRRWSDRAIRQPR